MGRPKGSKNKSKVVDTSTPLSKVKDTSSALPKVEKIDMQGYVDRLVQQDDLIRRQRKVIEEKAKVYLPEGTRKSTPVSVDDPRLPENREKISKTKGKIIDPVIEPMIITTVPIEIEEPEDEDDEPSLEDALKELGGEGEVVKKQRGLKQKKMKEQIDFLLEEVKNLRFFVCRVEDMMLGMLAKYPVPEIIVPELKKTRGKKPA